jgi:cellulose synthase (UDP-forming)
MPPTIIAAIAGLVAVFALWLALAAERWSWGKPSRYPEGTAAYHRIRRSPKYPELLVRGIVVVAAAFTLYYLIWRVSVLNPEAIWFSWLLWAAEAYGFVTFVFFAFMTWKLVHPETPPPREGISVDVMVPTYGEPLDVLRATLVGCNHIRYPHQTFVLDDAARPEVVALAAELDCNYISRPTHEGAKAGNLNYALKQTSGQLVAVLDADHVPLPEFLHNTIGFFDDSSVAVVQGPQLFYNLDSFQHERSSWHEQRVFYHAIMPGKNRTNSAFWCGSPAVLRRSALEDIGGVAQETVTEDLHTTIRLVRRGYRVVYTEKPLAAGLSPSTIEEYLGQRFRWGQGAMQVLRSKDSPLWASGLTFSQRISFLASTITYFDGLQLLILLAIPVITLLFGILPVSTFGWDFVVRLIPYLALIFLANTLLGRGTYNLWYVERYSLLRAFTFAATLPTLITGRARPFRVTRKGSDIGLALPWRQVIPHLITIGLCFIAAVVGVLHIVHPFWYQPQPMVLAVVIGWTVLNAILLSVGVDRLLSVSRRARYRFPIVTEISWRLSRETDRRLGHSVNLSASGISFEHSDSHVRMGDKVEVSIGFAITGATAPMVGGESQILLTGRVVGTSQPHSGGAQRVGLTIVSFDSNASANSYSYLLHHPANLLRGEQIFLPPED